MVGNVVLMIILAAAITIGGFLYMDYKIEEGKAKLMDRRVGQLRLQYQQDCQKD